MYWVTEAMLGKGDLRLVMKAKCSCVFRYSFVKAFYRPGREREQEVMIEKTEREKRRRQTKGRSG
jgi:hypothetical protein